MKFSRGILFVCLILVWASNTCGKDSSVLRDLFKRGKSFFSRSYELRQYDDPDDATLYPEHREEYEGFELEENSAPLQGETSFHSHHPRKKELLHHHPQHGDKHKGAYKLTYHTDMIENDNMDLYGIIGGLSFASLLATTLFILSRRNGSLLRSLDEVYRSDTTDLTYRGKEIAPNEWSREEVLSRLRL